MTLKITFDEALKITFDEALQIIGKAMPPPARGTGEDFYRTLHIREGFIEAQGAIIAEWQKSLAALDAKPRHATLAEALEARRAGE